MDSLEFKSPLPWNAGNTSMCHMAWWGDSNFMLVCTLEMKDPWIISVRGKQKMSSALWTKTIILCFLHCWEKCTSCSIIWEFSFFLKHFSWERTVDITVTQQSLWLNTQFTPGAYVDLGTLLVLGSSQVWAMSVGWLCSGWSMLLADILLVIILSHG